jgi:TetR/AcrR family transcriptional regulator, ethionamide resistance regulator
LPAVPSAESRAPARTAKRAAIQATVLCATEELLAEGTTYADLNVERIARRAGLSRTAFYFYFRDKREVLLRLTEDVNELFYGEADIWFSGTGDPEAELRQALTNAATLYGQHGVVLRAIVEVSACDALVAAFWRSLMARFVDAARRRIEADQAAGHAPCAPAAETAFALCWMTERAMYQQTIQGAPRPTPELVDALVAIWKRAIYGT